MKTIYKIFRDGDPYDILIRPRYFLIIFDYETKICNLNVNGK